MPPKKREYDVQCDQCAYMTNSKANLNLHLAQVHKIGSYPCDECKFVAAVPCKLKKHKEEHGMFACEQCTFVTNLLKEFNKHMTYKHSGRQGCVKFPTT